MSQKTAVFDDSLSFFRYLTASRRDRDWGLFVTGTGHEVMTTGAGLEPGAQGAPRYLYRVESGERAESGEQVSMSWDPSYPQPYRYEWNDGRKLVDEFALLYFDSGSPWVFESEATGVEQIEAGSVVLLFPGVWHRYRPMLNDGHPFSSTLWCTFGGETAGRWVERGLISPQKPVMSVGSDLALETGFRRLHNQLQARPLSLQRMLSASLWELFGAAEAAMQASAPALSPDVIQRAKGLLEDLTTPSADGKDVARALHLGYDPFRRAFKLATGLSPHQYRLQMLLRRAKELLEGSDLSMKQIAKVLHFTDQYYFAKAFRRKTGLTPTDWRQRSRREG